VSECGGLRGQRAALGQVESEDLLGLLVRAVHQPDRQPPGVPTAGARFGLQVGR
jgi:hypothetical protein